MIQSSSKNGRQIEKDKGGDVGYKNLSKELSFADLGVAKSMVNNRSVKMMEKIKMGSKPKIW